MRLTATKSATKGPGLKAVRGERYIYRRGDQLYFRRGVPDDVRGLFGGRAEVQVSLRTSSIAEARHRRQRELDKFEQAIAAYRGELAPSEIAQAPLRPSVRILEAGVRKPLQNGWSVFRASIGRTPMRFTPPYEDWKT